MLLGAGILGALAVAAAGAGWWLLGGMALAALLAEGARRSVGEPRGRTALALRAASRLALVVLFATVFVAYATPTYPVAAALGFVGLVVIALATGVRVSAPARKWLTGALLVAAMAFVALSVAIAPASPPAVTAPEPAGFLLSAAVLFPLFAGLRGSRLALGAAVVAVVAAAALYQLGPVRLGLSPTSLRDVLAAADATALQPVLVAVVVLATVPAALIAFDDAVEAAPVRSRTRGLLVLGLLAALLGASLSMLGGLLLAAAAALVEVLVVLVRAGLRRPLGAATAAVALALGAGLVFAL